MKLLQNDYTGSFPHIFQVDESFCNNLTQNLHKFSLSFLAKTKEL